MMKNDKKITISDIAAAAGVSKTTVSRYINGRTDLMSEKTRQRIKSIVEMSGYRPSDIARSLKSQKTNMIGVIVSDISSPFSSAIVLGVCNCLSRKGFTPIFLNSNDSPEQEERYLSSLLAKGVDGLIVNTASSQNLPLINLSCQGIPVVLCDRLVENHTFDIVTGQYEQAIQDAVAHLKKQGYSRPAFFTQAWEHNSVRCQRRQGYLKAMQLFYDRNAENDIYRFSVHGKPSAAEMLDRFLNTLKPSEVPAIIGVNSVVTMHLLNAIKARKLNMPNQIGLCGPEDWDWDPHMNWPQLVQPHITTMMVHAREIGEKSAELLLRRINNPTLPVQQVLLPSELIVRQSTLLRAE